MTLPEAQAELLLWQNALNAALAAGVESYTIAGRGLKRFSLSQLRAGRDEAQRRVDALAAGTTTGPRGRRVVYVDG